MVHGDGGLWSARNSSFLQLFLHHAVCLLQRASSPWAAVLQEESAPLGALHGLHFLPRTCSGVGSLQATAPSGNTPMLLSHMLCFPPLPLCVAFLPFLKYVIIVMLCHRAAPSSPHKRRPCSQPTTKPLPCNTSSFFSFPFIFVVPLSLLPLPPPLFFHLLLSILHFPSLPFSPISSLFFSSLTFLYPPTL